MLRHFFPIFPSTFSLSDLQFHTDTHNSRVDIVMPQADDYIDSAIDADKEYMYFVGSGTPPTVCYIHFSLSQSYNG